MKRLFLTLFLVIILSLQANAQTGSTTTPYDTLGWDAVNTRTPWYKLYIPDLLTRPGGRINLNFLWLDSLVNRFIVNTDTSELYIVEDSLSGNDTLRINPRFLDNAIQRAVDSGVVVTTVPDSVNILRYNNRTSAPTHKEGTTWYDSLDHSLKLMLDKQFTHRLGRETLIRVYNCNGDTLKRGMVGRFKAVELIGGVLEACFTLANAKEDSTSTTLGIATGDIAPGEVGYVSSFGAIAPVNTSAWNEKDVLYLDTLDGQMTNSICDFTCS